MIVQHKQNSLVSVIIPTFNRAELIGKAIRSVLDQTYLHFEILVVDNGSSDDTAAVVASFQDSRIHYFYQENSGSPVSPRNHAWSVSQGEYLAFLDSDDFWQPEKLAEQVAALRQDSTAGLCYTDCLLQGDGHLIGLMSKYHKPHAGDIFEQLLFSNFIAASTVMITRDMMQRFGPLDERFNIAHDYDLYLKISQEYGVKYVPQVLATARIHGSSMSRNHALTRLEAIEVLRPWCVTCRETRKITRVRRRAWAWHHFFAGVEMLSCGESRDQAVTFLRQALQLDRWKPMYWLGGVLSVLPKAVIVSLLALARKRWSVEAVMPSSGNSLHAH